MRLEELPRNENGAVVGAFVLRHRVPDFSEHVGAVAFAGGVSTSPVEGRLLERIMTFMADDLDAEPCEPMAMADAAATPEPTDSSAPQEEPAPAAQEPEALPSTPVNQAELYALSEPQLRAIAEEMGATDKRWKLQRLRKFIADELGIDIGDDG